jgi:hypothetical protein
VTNYFSIAKLFAISTRKFKPSGKFSTSENDHQSTTFSPAIHHKITTKNHFKIRTFSKTPLKNAHKQQSPGSLRGSTFFLYEAV